MSLTITPVYAGLLAFVYFYLTMRVVRRRQTQRISVGTARGDTDDREMLRAVRVHANFAEYAPFSLLLIAFAELAGAWPLLVHAMALVLVAGRVAHAYGLAQEPDHFPARRWGMYLTAAAILTAAAFCIVLGIRTWL